MDTTNRGQVFALLSALDLDLILTTDHEWCTFRELSGIAVHQSITGLLSSFVGPRDDDPLSPGDASVSRRVSVDVKS
ncbi:hypothetical protein GCM10018793_12080 [Streptomyces sulfonofaciens]|uniref:Uncharacterized protein n=1 Tax=Streptomyces sulfonofaciens TaxID=68272 RepID=A0A919KUX0_9ACTN|nr:hypothetical protein GCM10018793_12080 [Streptomyces sulfonofaciens]